MLGKGVEICLAFHRILGSLVFGWAPNHLVLGAQLAPGEKRLVCIPDLQEIHVSRLKVERLFSIACKVFRP